MAGGHDRPNAQGNPRSPQRELNSSRARDVGHERSRYVFWTFGDKNSWYLLTSISAMAKIRLVLVAREQTSRVSLQMTGHLGNTRGGELEIPRPIEMMSMM
jgi:hypothetical protein